MAYIDFTENCAIRREQYDQYEFQAELGGTLVLLNDSAETYNHLAAIKVGDKLLRFTLAEAAPTGTILFNDNICYQDVFPDVSLYYTTEPGRLKEYFLINSQDCRQSFTFLLEQEGTTATLKADNSIEFRDAADNLVWTIDAPTATDAAGKDVPTTIAFNGSSYTIGITPDANTQFPVCLDPTVNVSNTVTAWYQGLTYSTVNLGPKRYQVGRLGYTELLTSVELFSNRQWKDIATAVTTTVYDNSSPYVKTWYQWYDKNNVPLAEKADLVVSSSTRKVLLTVPADAYWLELTGQVAGVASTIQAYSQTYLNSLNYDDTKTSQWEMGDNVNFPGGQRSSSMKSHLGPIPASADGTPFTRTVYAYPGQSFYAGTIYIYAYRDSNGYIGDATINAYNAAGTLLSSVAVDTSTNGKSTSFPVPASTARIEASGTFRSLTANASTAYIAYNLFYLTSPSTTTVLVFQAARDYSGARYAPELSPDMGITPRCFVSINSQTDYVETNKITASKGDMVYIKLMRQSGDATSYKLQSTCLVLIPEYFEALMNGDLVRKLISSTASLADTNRRAACNALTNGDTLRQSVRAFIINSDTIRRVTKGVLQVIPADTARKITKRIAAYADTKRKAAANNNFVSDTKRRIKAAVNTLSDSIRSVCANTLSYFDSKRIVAIATWEYQKDCSIQIDIEGDSQTMSLNQSINVSAILSPFKSDQLTTGGGPFMLIQGTHAVININVFQTAEEAFDLTDCAVKLIITAADTKANFLVPAAILNPIEGRACAYLAPEHLPTGGMYEYQVQVIFPDGTVSKTAISAFYVADSLQTA